MIRSVEHDFKIKKKSKRNLFGPNRPYLKKQLKQKNRTAWQPLSDPRRRQPTPTDFAKIADLRFCYLPLTILLPDSNSHSLLRPLRNRDQPDFSYGIRSTDALQRSFKMAACLVDSSRSPLKHTAAKFTPYSHKRTSLPRQSRR